MDELHQRETNQRITLTIPTFLERDDAWLDGGVLGVVALATGYWVFVYHLPFAWTIPAWVLTLVWSMTGESMTDVKILGPIAAGVRRRLGLRRGHEWILAYLHYAWAKARPAPEQRLNRPLGWARQHWPGRLAWQPWAGGQVLKAVVLVTPKTNYAMSSPREQAGDMEALARVLMGLSYRIQIIGQARPFQGKRDWPTPPELVRSWKLVVRAHDPVELALRVRLLVGAIDSVGLRPVDLVCEDEQSARSLRDLERRLRLTVRIELPSRRNVVMHPDCLEVDGEWCSSVVMRLWPREVPPGWLGIALAGELPVDVGIHTLPQDAQEVARFLRTQQRWQAEDFGAERDAANALGARDAQVNREALIARTDRPVKVAIALTVWAGSRADLALRVETLRHEVGLALAEVRVAKYEQDYGLEATQASGRCRVLGCWRLVNCMSAASTWIMQPATVDHANGAEIGTTRDGSMLVKLDPFDKTLESFAGLVVAKVGAGKSFFLKLLARRLKGVELYIVEQQYPAEYTGLSGAHVLNLADFRPEERRDALKSWLEAIWEDSKLRPRPKLLILDELWSLLKDAELAELVNEIARIGRHHWLSLWIATQQVKELINNGQAVLDNVMIRVYLKQHDNDLDKLCEATGLGATGKRFLRSASRGHALLDCDGMLVPVEIQATPEEHAEITTDPREKYADGMVAIPGHLASAHRNGHAADPVPAIAQGHPEGGEACSGAARRRGAAGVAGE